MVLALDVHGIEGSIFECPEAYVLRLASCCRLEDSGPVHRADR